MASNSDVATILASNMARNAASNMAESLDPEPLRNETDGDEVEKQSALRKMQSTAVYVLLLCGAATSAAAMAIFTKAVTIVMGVVCFLNVPTSIYKEMQLAKLPTLRSLNNKMREEVNDLTGQVDLLGEEIDKLKPEADRLAQGQEELAAIAEQQGAQVDSLIELVKENKEINAQMRDNLRDIIVQGIVTIVVGSDRDNDQTIDEREARIMALKIDLSLKEQGVAFDQKKFLKVIGGSTSLHAIIDIVKKLLPKKEDDDDSDSDDDDDDYDMFHMSEEKGGASLRGRAERPRSARMIREVKKQSSRAVGGMKGTMV